MEINATGCRNQRYKGDDNLNSYRDLDEFIVPTPFY
jgi:hypothetical protein